MFRANRERGAPKRPTPSDAERFASRLLPFPRPVARRGTFHFPHLPQPPAIPSPSSLDRRECTSWLPAQVVVAFPFASLADGRVAIIGVVVRRFPCPPF